MFFNVPTNKIQIFANEHHINLQENITTPAVHSNQTKWSPAHDNYVVATPHQFCHSDQSFQCDKCNPGDFLRHIEVNDMPNIRDIQTLRRHIRSDQHIALSSLKSLITAPLSSMSFPAWIAIRTKKT